MRRKDTLRPGPSRAGQQLLTGQIAIQAAWPVYSTPEKEKKEGDEPAEESRNRVSRFEMTCDDPPRIDPESEQIVLTWLAEGHNGGCLKFGPEGYLYISTGDGKGPSPPDELRSGQDVTTLLSAILRIDVDHQEKGRNYRVPSDNPLLDVVGARGEIWSYGYRIPWKMSFDKKTGDLWVGDVGWQLWEMVYRVKKGGNYGWSIMEGRQTALPEQEPGPTPILPPTIDHPHSEAASITGGYVYHGQRLKSLAGAYIYGDYQTGIVWGARMKGEEVAWHKELAHTPLQLVGFGEDNSGELFLLDHAGMIYRLIENPEPDRSKNFPRKLSETGLFASLTKLEPAPGVIEYSINAQHWADEATSRRWLAVGGSKQITMDAKGNWQFPDGSVIAKMVSMKNLTEGGGAASSSASSRLETQILHREAGSWRPYTYVWNDEQTDASLAPADGFSRILQIRDSKAADGVREQTYRFAGQKECLMCHNPWVEARTTIFGVQSASLLGIHANQLNRHHAYADGSADQLSTLRKLGLMIVDSSNEGKETVAFVAPYDESADLDSRARSYLHVNCAHCHQMHAGGAANIVLTHDVKLEATLTANIRPTQGTFAITDARVIAPGDPTGSVLLYRMAKLGGGRMPRAGSGEVDSRGVKMIGDWIAQLSSPEADKPAVGKPAGLQAADIAGLDVVRGSTSAEDRGKAISQLFSTTRGAMAMLRLIDGNEVSAEARPQIVSLSKNHQATEIRDLFERFVPMAERIKRLGTVVNQAQILSLEADVDRGKSVFFKSAAAACSHCHRIDGTGETLGPDLSRIGTKYRRDQLLGHILEPSKFMEPKYVPYVLETSRGRVLSGLLEKKTATEVVIKDAKNKRHRVAARDVELLVHQQKSIMPELLLRDMTRQQAADLLAYLSSRK